MSEHPQNTPPSADAARILQRIADAYIVLDREYRFVEVNPAAERSMQKSLEELRGRVHWEVFPASYDITAGRCYRAAAETKVAQHFTEHYRYEGYDVYLEMDAYPTEEGGVAVFWRDVTTRVKAEAATRASEERYALAARAASNIIWDWDLAAGRITWSAGLQEVLGYGVGEGSVDVAWRAAAIHPDDRARVLAGMQAALERDDSAQGWRDTFRFRRGDGTYARVIDRAHVARDTDGRPTRMVGAMEDISVRVQLEDQLRQAQKMEAVGQLAGGVAHDFNNLLTVISGNLEFARGDLEAEHPVRRELDEIAGAAERARTLVRQLLAFSRKRSVEPSVCHMGEVVRGAVHLLQRVIGEEITLQVQADPKGPAVLADAAQIEQVLMNLVVNARDAMMTPRNGHPGKGGILTLEVSSVDLASGRIVADGEIAPGRYAQLVVRDTGHGIDAETRAHIFEPFFTTKDAGLGTGLGLATVHGIVQQAKGAIRVDSTVGEGTTFTVLFPVADPSVRTEPPSYEMPVTPATPTTLLVVEDEAAVRAVTRRALERHGYIVLEARHGADALLLWREHASAIAAVVTDIRMPEMGGPDLIERLREERPSLPVVFLSGYAWEGTRLTRGPLDRFVEKPFTTDALIRAVGLVLAASES